MESLSLWSKPARPAGRGMSDTLLFFCPVPAEYLREPLSAGPSLENRDASRTARSRGSPASGRPALRSRITRAVDRIDDCVVTGIAVVNEAPGGEPFGVPNHVLLARRGAGGTGHRSRLSVRPIGRGSFEEFGEIFLVHNEIRSTFARRDWSRIRRSTRIPARSPWRRNSTSMTISCSSHGGVER